jgi:hypothetical protein
VVRGGEVGEDCLLLGVPSVPLPALPVPGAHLIAPNLGKVLICQQGPRAIFQGETLCFSAPNLAQRLG